MSTANNWAGYFPAESVEAQTSTIYYVMWNKTPQCDVSLSLLDRSRGSGVEPACLLNYHTRWLTALPSTATKQSKAKIPLRQVPLVEVVKSFKWCDCGFQAHLPPTEPTDIMMGWLIHLSTIMGHFILSPIETKFGRTKISFCQRLSVFMIKKTGIMCNFR